MALVATIGGNRPPVSVEQVRQYLVSFHGVAIDRFSVHLYSPEDFLVVFSDLGCRDRVLHGAPPRSPPFRLTWRPWLRLSMATPDKMRFKVLLVLRGIPTHAWSLDSAQRVLGSSCAGLEATRETIDKVDLKRFVVAAWCAHPHLIPSVKRLWVPEPKKPHEPGNLFLREHEVMHTVFPGMTYAVSVQLVELQEWFVRPSREASPDCRDSGDDEDYPGFHEFDEDDSWQPWPRRSRFVVDASLPALGPGWGDTFQYGNAIQSASVQTAKWPAGSLASCLKAAVTRGRGVRSTWVHGLVLGRFFNLQRPWIPEQGVMQVTGARGPLPGLFQRGVA
ncbi:hypothetical protein BS78_01G028200 [Paspalum vaginatum]|nr:hypothetical protein BS78_01G028200 [Paspalum vaginatum]